jgi:superfamily II DNA or RNA helicase
VGQPTLRRWQTDALALWEQAGHRGIASVVTGAGKTVFALACISRLQPACTLVVVPTVALLDQWWVAIAEYFDLELDEVNLITGKGHVRTGTINLAVLNTASKLHQHRRDQPLFLIVDECHKAGSEQFRSVLDIPMIASLGLSATPARPYDAGLDEVIIPALGPVIFEYTYRDALRDQVIVPFSLRNIVFELEPETLRKYEKFTKAIAQSIKRHGLEAPETISILLRRARLVNLSLNRVRLALKIVAAHRGERVLIFHESIEAGELIQRVLVDNNVKSGIYHSRMPLRTRADTLAAFRTGHLDVLVACRALDEGFDVPEAEVGIIAASTATKRQRIQRLGRVLRPAGSKRQAVVYSLAATRPEISRLRKEEKDLEGVAAITWSRA